MQRDKHRAARHKDTYVPGSRRSVQDSASPELPRHAEVNVISDTTPLDISPVPLLNSSATCFDPNAWPVKHGSEHSTKLNSTFVSMSSSETGSLTREDPSCTIDSDYADPDLDVSPPLPPMPHDISEIEDCDNDGYKCLDEACSYGPKDLVGVCFVNISICHKCKNVYICDECLSKGRHQRHSPFIKPSIPFLT